MLDFVRQVRLLAVVTGGILLLLGMTSCSRSNTVERAKVRAAFGDFRLALLHGDVKQILTYVPEDVGVYLATLDSPNLVATPQEVPAAPSVDLLLRTALARKVDPNLRKHLTLQELFQRLANQGVLNCREIRDLSIGRVNVKGDRASADLYYQGKPLPFRLPFVRQDRVWRVDILVLLPYAEILMRLDRALTGKTETEQVSKLVQPLPSL